MDDIKQIIQTLSADEQLEFERFVHRVSPKGQELVLRLFGLMTDTAEPSREALMTAIYNKSNYNAYKALRKRLLALLQRFIALKLIDGDSSNTSQVLSLVNLARYLYGNKEEALAHKYLKKAENQAVDNELYEVLNSIYMLQIAWAGTQQDADLDELITKRNANKLRLEKVEQMEIALGVLARKIKSQSRLNFEQIAAEAIAQTHADGELLNEPRFLYQFTVLIRSNLLLQKDFAKLSVFLETQFERLQKAGFAKNKPGYYHIAFLYLMAHSAYRNKQFAVCMERLKLLQNMLPALPAFGQQEFLGKMWLLEAQCLLFTQRIAEATRRLNQLEPHPLFQKSKVLFNNRITNLSIALALQQQYRMAKLELLKISGSDTWLTKEMGEEWLLKKSIIEAILYYELGDDDLLHNKIRYIKTKFKRLLSNPLYQRALVFVALIERLDGIGEKERKSLEAEIETAFNFVPVEQEDLQAMVFYAWLKSKITATPPYEVLLGLIGY
ncbi:hypothetical protein GC194_00240 [bacterium]|nr:hypothetical protein [bacterium]